ncbi:MAG: NAD(P)-dependent alcohol dehydrogenase [Anaerolineales bacterium]|nr:NAD(P)-dependent alcohol dehydrogenase [Anaerolineales bacterium]
MKAIVCTKYGPPDVLELQEVKKPVPNEDEALVKIQAASLNAADLENMRGEFVVRIAAPFRPMYRILGTDFAGTIEAVGKQVKQFQPGEEIWGDLSFPLGSATFAEYVCVPEDALRLKPASMTFEEAASIPTAAVVALQNLRDKRPIQPGQKVLINGAGGGVGTFAVQLAKYFGAEVTGVDSSSKLDMLRSIGADHVIDYKQEDFTTGDQHYDLVLNVVAYRSIFTYRRALRPGGTFVYVGGSTSAIFQALLFAPLLTRNSEQKMGIVPWKPNDKADMQYLTELFEAGKISPVIDRSYPLSEVSEAARYLEGGHVKGKLVVTVK